jgi:tRNA(Ile)-lysidine synthase
MSKKVYIIAVSGGIDSVVLLHKLMSVKPPSISYIVAHLDHGIREDSRDDALFVRELAQSYSLDFELESLQLGSGASEDEARNARYAFLFAVMKKHKAEAVITAHHQDDVLETMIVNIFRGTTRRGVIGYSQKNIIRPFIDKTKAELVAYAKVNNLQWREDNTNKDENYTRNYIRAHIVPKLGEHRRDLLEIRNHISDLQIEIEDLSKKMLVQTLQKQALVRSDFVVLPYIVQLEIMATWLRVNRVEYDQKTIANAVNAAKTMLPNKHIELAGGATLHAHKKIIVLNVEPHDV